MKKKVLPTTTYKKKNLLEDYMNIQKGLGLEIKKSEAQEDLDFIAESRFAKLKILEKKLRCPKDGSKLERIKDAFKCLDCGAIYEINNCGAVNFLPESLKKEFAIIDTAGVSAHTSIKIDERLSKILKDNPKAVCLDCGCGYKTKEFIENNPRVINFEIVEYPSTDFVGVGEKLPFADNTFDCILSTSVLEHVKNPFLCASEMKRVLKKDGEILCSVPFLIPYHGYPHHYYNPTYQGLENLFEGLDVISNEPGNPIYSLTSLVGFWRNGLSKKDRRKFDKIKLRKLAKIMNALHSNQDVSILEEPWVKNLNKNTVKLIAWGNTLLAKKK
jgi:SAM-dependent methyltransferase